MGSSSQLSIRLNGYLNNKHRVIDLLLPQLKVNLDKFILIIIPLNDNYPFISEIVLEQYYLLDSSFSLNTVKVANNPTGKMQNLYICIGIKLFYITFQCNKKILLLI